jgi:hypothetical protein
MKKIVLFFLLVLFAHSGVLSQNFYIRGGLNVADALLEGGGFTVDTKARIGFQLGVAMEVPMSDNLYFNTAMLYSSKGLKVSDGGIEIKVPINYLEVPLNLEYKSDAGDASIFVEAGPYLGIGLSGKAESGGTSESIEWGSADGELKRLDLGLNFGGGVEIDRFRIGINYGLGLTNLENIDGVTTKIRNFAIFAALKIGQ